MTESPFRASASVSASGRASRRGPFRTIFMLAAALVVAGCASGEPVEPGGIADPYESTNRGIHEFNKGLDTVLLRPASQLYDIAMPGLGDLLLTNAVNFLRMPMNFINHTAQGEFEQAGADVLRTGINLVMGLGVLDPATEFGLPQVETDIGETLYVWGVGEGPYVEIPVFGPASARDGFGRVAEIVLDPFGFFTRHLSFPYSFPASGAVKKCSWQSNVSKVGFKPATMNHRPSNMLGSNSLTSLLSSGTG